MLDEKAIVHSLPSEVIIPQNAAKRVNYLSVSLFSISVVGNLLWMIWALAASHENIDARYPAFIFTFPFLIIILSPSIIASLLILGGTFMTVLRPEGLVRLELSNSPSNHRLLYLPLGLTGFIMIVFSVYYSMSRQGCCMSFFGIQGVLGALMLLLFWGGVWMKPALLPIKDGP